MLTWYIEEQSETVVLIMGSGHSCGIFSSDRILIVWVLLFQWSLLCVACFEFLYDYLILIMELLFLNFFALFCFRFYWVCLHTLGPPHVVGCY